MKKLLGISVLFVLTIGLATAATISVYLPKAGDVWTTGPVQYVYWTVTGNLPNLYTITFMNAQGTTAGQGVRGYVKGYGAGVVNWPYNVSPGPYRVRVASVGTPVFGDSAVFTVHTDSIKITQPTAASQWCWTKTYNITWNIMGNLPWSVKIDLESPTNQLVKVIAAEAPNSGSYSWTVPAGLPMGKYTIHIQYPIILNGNPLLDLSPLFEIGPLMPAGLPRVKK